MVKLNPVLCEETNRIQMSFIHYGHAVLGPWWKGSVDSLECSQLYYIISGSAKFLCGDDQLLTMEPGNWYLLPSGTSVTYWCDDYMEEVYVHLKLCNIDHIDLLKNSVKPCHLKIQENITDFLLHCINSQSPLDGIRLRQIVFDVLLRFIDEYNITMESKKFSPCVSKAIAYINHHQSMHLTVDEIVENTSVSKSTLEKRFKEELHTSIHEYLSSQIMFEASQLLRKTKLTVHDISEQLGFCDQFYFSKWFKDHFKISPKDYRKTIPM